MMRCGKFPRSMDVNLGSECAGQRKRGTKMEGFTGCISGSFSGLDLEKCPEVDGNSESRGPDHLPIFNLRKLCCIR